MALSIYTLVFLFLSHVVTLTYAQKEWLQRIDKLENKFDIMEEKSIEREKINHQLNAEIKDQKKEVRSLRDIVAELQTELAYYKKQLSDKHQSVADSTTVKLQTSKEDDVSKVLPSSEYPDSMHPDQQFGEANHITKEGTLNKANNISESGKNPRSDDILRRLVLPIPTAKPMTNVAFHAVNSKLINTRHPYYATFVFDKVHLNVGNIYDSNTGRALIHTSGLYLFSVSVYGYKNQINNTNFGQLYISPARNAPLAKISLHGVNGSDEGFYTGITYVAEGQFVFVRPNFETELSHNGYASFSGVLIAEM